MSSLIRYLPTFRMVAEDLSFSATARRLGLSPAAVSKTIRTFEGELGVRLFHRSTHALSLTDEGQELLRGLGDHIEALDSALTDLTASPDRPRGVLRVAAPSVIGRHLILPLLPEFRRRYPQVVLDLRFDELVTDIVKEGIDVAIGSRGDPNVSLIGKRLFASQALVVASPQFIEEHGAPQTLDDISRFPCIGYRMPKTGRIYPWTFRDPETGTTTTLTPDCTITASDLMIVADLAAGHHGLALSGTGSLSPYLQAGTLVTVLSEYAADIAPVTLFYSTRKDLPARVRVFVDFVSEHMLDPND